VLFGVVVVSNRLLLSVGEGSVSVVGVLGINGMLIISEVLFKKL